MVAKYYVFVIKKELCYVFRDFFSPLIVFKINDGIKVLKPIQ